MKRIIALMTVLSLPILAEAVYVNYNLSLYPIDEYTSRPYEMGYYMLLIDSSGFDESNFNKLLTSGSKDLGDIPFSAVIYKSEIYSATNPENFSVNTTAAWAYLALFNTTTFPGDADYILYGRQSLTSGSVSFGENYNPWYMDSTHVTDVHNTIPEPSSGLLTLAGLSIFALKRKRRSCVFS